MATKNKAAKTKAKKAAKKTPAKKKAAPGKTPEKSKKTPAKKAAKKPVAKKTSAKTTKKVVKKAKVAKQPVVKKAVKRPAPAKKASAKKVTVKKTSSKPSASAVRRLEYTSGASGKFWEAEVSGALLVLRWGKLGTSGQTKTKDVADPAAALGEMDKVAASKLKKGYVEVGAKKVAAKTAPAKTPVTTTKGPSTATLKYVTTVARGDIEVVGRKQNSKGEFESFDVGCTLEEHENLTASYVDGVLFAAFTLEGDEVVFRFPRPSDPTALDGVEKFYRPLKTPVNWLEYRRPLSRDPRPDLQAGFSMIGVSQREFLQRLMKSTPKGPPVDQLVFEYADAEAQPLTVQRNPLEPISTLGGPYVALPESSLDDYPGAEDSGVYEQVCSGDAIYGDVMKIVGTTALVLGSPDHLLWWPEPKGGVLVRVPSIEDDSPEALRSQLNALPKKGWTKMTGTLKVTEPWWVFDSASAGNEAQSSGLKLDLEAGTYSLTKMTHPLGEDGEEGEFILVRLSRK